VHEGTDVLRQAAATEPEPGLEETTTDAVVEGEGMGKELDVGPPLDPLPAPFPRS